MVKSFSLALFFMLIIVSCSPIKFEVCDINGAVYKSLIKNYADWISFFKQAENENETLKIRINHFNYAVRLHANLTSGTTIYIPTNTGIPASIRGKSGYFYTEGNTLVFDDNRYRVTQLTDKIYCYERV